MAPGTSWSLASSPCLRIRYELAQDFQSLRYWWVFVFEDGEDRIKGFDSAWLHCPLQKLGRRISLV